ncbi:hypothetical protein FH972_010309 [Carpinus fangiana]|uniref:Uncharacterized protein n=1 Tax=Carpinus fangiana TaxID=176857 RepID=A0A660KR17_9ROSI|nr:hypothetical protein FH972_010309 [Carpinus fangiana]
MEKSAAAEIHEEANALIKNVDGNSESQREANSPSGRVDREANASVRNEHQDTALANDITQMIESWEPPPPRKTKGSEKEKPTEIFASKTEPKLQKAKYVSPSSDHTKTKTSIQPPKEKNLHPKDEQTKSQNEV